MKKYSWRDTFQYAVRATYYINDSWEARLGYRFEEGVQNEFTSVSAPDSNPQWFSIGATYQINKEQVLDVSFSYIVGKEQKVSDSISIRYSV
ncbi:outer membrane protein transport protein [Vibrio tubiashii]|uniref:outer membrane protein transport protein n=1 Tax=Vibrio tubiashii TaxID=29498 RepID=UPI00349E724E